MLILDQLKRNDPQLRALSVAVLVGMSILIAGLWYVQVVSYQRYEKSLITQSFRTVRIPGVRGSILDRNGVVLAENKPSYNVNIYLEELRPYFQGEYSNMVRVVGRPKEYSGVVALGKQARYKVISNIVQHVSGVVRQPLEIRDKDFHSHYEERKSLPMPVTMNLSVDQVARFAETASGLPGVDLEAQPLRSYPHFTAAAHLIGHLTPDNSDENEEEMRFNYRLPDYRGLIGIEATFDEELRGKWGAKSMLVNNLHYRQSESVIEEPRPGDNVILTIDVTLQKAVETALRGAQRNTQGAAVVLDVHSGDILAMASEPTFDPNVWVPRISSAEYAQLNDPEMTPMMNRASFGVYQPGSIFKIIVGLAALEAGVLKPEREIHCPGFYRMTPRSKPMADNASGDFDFKEAFYLSSNYYFVTNGLLAGVDRILEMGQRFCLGQKSGLPTRQDAGGYFPTPGTRQKNAGGVWLDGDTANLSIGQGEITVTPLQMAVMVAAIANGGKVLWPRLVDRLEPADPFGGEAIRRFPRAQVRNELHVNPRNLQIIRDAMLADVEHPRGTGVDAHVSGFRVCGKTGTAEVQKGGAVDYKTTWFASFGPYENPRYAVIVMVDRGRSGGKSCTPVAKKIYEAIVAMEKRQQSPRTSFANVN